MFHFCQNSGGKILRHGVFMTSQQSSNQDVITVDRLGNIIHPILIPYKAKAQYLTEPLPNEVSLEMAAISYGNLRIGRQKLYLLPLYMSKYPITQEQWRAIASRKDLKVKRDLDSNPAYFKDRSDSARRPVEQVNWYDAVEFCQRLSKQTGREYRLPSEAEWEYACRAGTTTPFHFGETITGQLANYYASATYADEPKGKKLGETRPVGSFFPNAFGLYDMHGNVCEWCQDDSRNNYAPTNGSAWLSGNSSMKVVRGGSWDDLPGDCRSASRYEFNPTNRDMNIGFRVVCVPPVMYLPF